MKACLPSSRVTRCLTFASLLVGMGFSATAEETPATALNALKTKRVPVRLGTSPALSPGGRRLAFGWAGDVWIAPATGGVARQLSAHPARENGAVFSPDGQRIAFTSNRTGKDQVFVMPVRGGLPTQVTFHSEGSKVVAFYPDGKSLLIEGTRDFGTRTAGRFYRVSLERREAERLLFDAEGHSGALSPDGKRLLFCREGGDLYRKGYRGSRSSQIWMAENLENPQPKFTRLIARATGARSPQWKPDSSGFYYLGDHGPGGRFDVWERDLTSRKEKRLTDFRDDPAILPGIAADGSAMVFRKGFDFFRLDLADSALKPLRLMAATDTLPESETRRTLSQATNLSFSADGLEIAFIAGGDLWVMDTELREPVAITRTAVEEREPVFSPDGGTIFFLRDQGSEADVWSVKRADAKTYWWRNRGFVESRVTKDGAAKNDLRPVPGGGGRISWISGLGDLWMAKADGSEARRLLTSWNQPDYDWAPDGKWIAWSVSDDDFNSDVWIAPVDGGREPYNLSRHPDSDRSPRWSPDGKILAFTGRRNENETDIHYVYLSRADEEKDTRARKLITALEKMDKARPKPAPPEPVKDETKDPPQPSATKPETEKPTTEKPTTKKLSVAIDFDGLYERLRHIAIKDSAESGLFWAHDSKRLAFSAEINGAKGTYTVTFPDKLSPTRLTTQQGSLARWIAKDDTLLWMVGGVPASLSKGKAVSYPFTARQTVDRREHWRVGFRQIWRTMRDQWYDANLNHLDWEAIGEKYESAAVNAADAQDFDRVVAMMLGELNGSHLGYRSHAATSAFRPSGGWQEETAHLGVTFDRTHRGPGWKIESVIPEGPADRGQSRLAVGQVILKIDGTAITADTDPTLILNGPLDRDLRLTLAAEKGKPAPEEIILRPISQARARELAQRARIDAHRALVDKLSQGRLGYVFVPRMAWSEFIKFEEEIFARGAGKDGLIIDVRDNGGGFTADHLLTVLTPAEHAVTVPRGGGPGYPQDRRVYATWSKPITVLCNQNSFSNAEIFSHAIKELGRGKLVGVATAGGVISTGSTGIMDLGTLRLPFRGWYRKSDGADLELNGAVPDIMVWDHPGDIAAGRDRQIARAVRVLSEEVAAEKARPHPALTPASQQRAAADD